MTRGRKIATIVAASVAGLLAIAFVVGVLIVRTDWFRNTVRQKIVTAVEDATGGKVDIGSFAFDWTHLRAEVRGFVIHGLEPAGAAPLFSAQLVQIDLKLTSPFHGFVDLAYLLVDTPAADIIVYPDGRTNIPAPKIQPKSSDKSGVETIVDLAVGRFDLRNGAFTLADRKTPLSASGASLRAQLKYNVLSASYSGEIDASPVRLESVDVDVKLPLKVEKDKITLSNAQFTTAQSRVIISGTMDHLLAPRTSAHVNAQVALDEIKRAFGLAIPLDTAHGPHILNADVTASMGNDRVEIQSARASLGGSDIEASGNLKQGAQFRSTLALGELGKLFRVAQRPEGTLKIGGNASLDANNDYKVTANVDARGVAIHQGSTRISGVSLDSALQADPHNIELSGLRLTALGGGFTGSASIAGMEKLHVSGNLHNFDIAQISRTFAPSVAGYDGVISGPVQADADIRDFATLIAKAKLAIAPAAHGIPVSGHLGVNYNGRAGSIDLDHSHIALPHSTADLSGSLGKRIDVKLVTHDAGDFRPLANIPVTFTGAGAANLDLAVTGKLNAPHIAGTMAVTNFAVDGRSFTRFSAAVDATGSSASVQNAVLSRGPLQALFSATAGLHNWKPENYGPLKADLTVRNADVRDILALAGQSGIAATGMLQADAHITGTLGSPTGSADLSVARGTLRGEAFDSLNARLALAQTTIDLQSLTMIAGPSRVDATASYRHAVNDLQRGTVTAHVVSNQVQVGQFRQDLRGLVNLNADVTASVSGGNFELSTVNGTAAARNLEMEGKALGDATVTATTANAALHYDVNSNFAGSTIHVTGQSLLGGEHQTRATAAIANLPLDRVLAVMGRRDLPVKGTLTANANLAGTLANPRGNGTFTIANGAAYNEPFTRIQATVNYTDVLIDVPQLRIDDGPSNLELSATFNHPAGNLEDGQLRFRAHSNEVQLSRIHAITAARPGLAGIVQLTADGAATLHRNAPAAIPTLNAQISAHNLSVDKKDLGSLTASAVSRGNGVDVTVNSDVAKSRIQGSGRIDLSAGYPIDARLNFSGVTWAGLSPLLSAAPQPFDASVDGQLAVNGPAARPEALNGSVKLTRLEAHSIPTGATKKPRARFDIHNAGDIQASLANSVVTVQSCHLTGPYTNLQISGTAGIKDPQSLNLRANGNVNLEALQAFSSDIYSSGSVTLNAGVTGNVAQPVILGRLQLQGASFHMLSLPNGITNATGSVSFNGTEASIDNVTGETGGGRVTLAGNVSYGGTEPQFRIQATAAGVHVDYPESVTTEADARITLAGTESRSLLSGDVTVLNVAVHSHSDIGSIFAAAATPPSSDAAATGLLGGMRFDVRIQTSPDAQFRTGLTQDLQADADLRLRGTPDHPGMLGRLVVNSGDVIFFGAKYTVDQGVIAFYDPNKITPVLNVDLETTVQGVNVTVSVSGRIDKMKLAYHSDPPLEFQQIVSLLASGKQPTTDPVLAAHQPAAQQQNIEQAGASTLLGQTVASPVSGRLQRLFGVSKLSIDPQIVGSTSNNPQATLTLQQQVTHDITFTYIQDVTQSNPSAVRIEWAINPRFSAIAQRDIYGEFALDFFYKKRFH